MDFIDGAHKFKTIDNHVIKINSQRLKLFKEKGITCVKCKLKGEFFGLDLALHAKRPHLNLYAIKDGKEILFTKDHIKPKSKGGKNKLKNYQVMCEPCNSEKSDKYDEENK